MQTEIYYAIKLSITGMLIVFSSLVLIAVAISILRRIDEKLTPVAPPETNVSETNQNIDNTTLVLISAATATILQHKKYRISSVKRLVTRDARIAGWTIEGRSVLHGSHVLNVKTDK